MRNLVWILSMFIAMACWDMGKHQEDSDGRNDNDGLCDNGDSRCEGDLISHCEEGDWKGWDDCAARNMKCALTKGKAVCIEGAGDGDADSDGDADADGDADSARSLMRV